MTVVEYLGCTDSGADNFDSTANVDVELVSIWVAEF